jgi:hypothetical protein
VTAQAQNNLLVAVFGEVDEATVDTLVVEVLNSK